MSNLLTVCIAKTRKKFLHNKVARALMKRNTLI